MAIPIAQRLSMVKIYAYRKIIGGLSALPESVPISPELPECPSRQRKKVRTSSFQEIALGANKGSRLNAGEPESRAVHIAMRVLNFPVVELGGDQLETGTRDLAHEVPH